MNPSSHSISVIEHRMHQVETRQEDFENRIRILEAVRWKSVGIISAVTFLASILGAVLVKKLIP